MPDAGYFGLTYELLFEGDSAWTDITALVDSRTTKIDIAGCSEELKSVISKCTFEMRYNTNPSKTVHSELVGKILSAKQAGQRVLFRMGGIASFVGKVDLGSFSQRNGRIPGFLTVTVEDNSYLLDEVMASSFEYPTTEDLDDEGYAVFDKTNLAESIVMLRLLDAGYTVDQIDLTTSDSITEKVRRVVYDADDERTYREMLDTLLFEHCAVIYTTPEGKLSVRRLYRESPVSERSVEEFLVGDGIETGGGDYSYDGVKVVWSNLSKLDGAVVYNANITMKLDDEGNREGEEIQPHHYWPEDGDIEETWQEFNATFLDREYQTKVSRTKNKDLSLISVKNAYYEVDKDAEILLANNPPEIEPTKARVLWWNSHSTDVKKLYGFTIVGDALFRSRLNESTYPTDARKLAEPYETEFVYTSEAAQKLANHLHRFYKYGDIHHRWSEIGVDTPMFQVVTVSAPDTLISSLGMVISQSISFPAPNKIKRSNSAIGITAFNSEPVKTRSIQLGGAPVNTGPAGENGMRSVVQFILGTADGPYTDAGNILGTDAALVGTSLALVGVDGAQWEYSAPTPDAGEFVWRREGYYTPPETWPKVWNITRMTGASSFGITLHPSALTVPVSSRGVPYGGNITISAVFQNIPTTYEITWGITGASFVDAGTNQTKVVDVSTITADAVIVTVSVLFGGVTYTDMATLNKVWDGLPAPLYLGKLSTVPTVTPEGDPLVTGDFFFYSGESITDSYQYGHIYKYNATTSVWSSSVSSYELGAAAKDAFAEARSTGNYVYAAVVYAQNVYAQNMVVMGEDATLVDGEEYYALHFDGVDDYVDCGSLGTFPAGGTITFNMKADSLKDYNNVLSTKFEGSNVGIRFEENASGGFSVNIGDDSGNFSGYSYGTINTSQMYNVVLAWYEADGRVTGYLDGVEKFNVTGHAYFPTTIPQFAIGNGFDSTRFWNGYIKDVRLYEYYMPSEDVAVLVAGGTVITYMTHQWLLDSKAGTTATDSVGTAHGTVYGALWHLIDETTGTGFVFRALSDDVGDGSGVPRLGAYYDGKRLWKVNPTTGEIFFGEHFWYDPSDGAIHTPNNKTVIRADGTIEAVDGRFSGDVIANSGIFKGIFDTTALKLEPGDTTAHNFTQASSMYQARNFFNALTSFGLKVNTFYKASTSVSSIQMYTQMPTLDNTSTIDLSDLSYIRITSAIYNGATIYHLQLFDSAKALIPAMPGWPFNSLMYHNSNNYAMTTTSFTITVYTGGDKLILSSDIPDNPTGLANYQIYHTDGALHIKLP